VASALVVAACGGNDTSTPAPAAPAAPGATEAPADPISIAFVASELDITQYFGQYNDAMRETLDAAGL
jgi:hypothetical protein